METVVLAVPLQGAALWDQSTQLFAVVALVAALVPLALVGFSRAADWLGEGCRPDAWIRSAARQPGREVA